MALHIRGRDIEEETSLALQFERESCQWSFLGSMGDIRSKERAKIILALREVDKPLSIAEIMEATEIERGSRTILAKGRPVGRPS